MFFQMIDSHVLVQNVFNNTEATFDDGESN